MTTSRTTPAPRPTAGALRLIEASTTQPTTVDLSDYAGQMTAHCPYLAPSLRAGLTRWTVYRAHAAPPKPWRRSSSTRAPRPRSGCGPC